MSAELTRVTLVRMTPEMHERLAELAEMDERSVSWLIRRAVRDYLDQREGVPGL